MNVHKFVISSFVLIFINNITAKNNGNTVVSEIQKFILNKSDTSKVNTLLDLAAKYGNAGKYRQAIKYCDYAITISNSNHFDKLQINAYRIKSAIYRKQNDLIHAKINGKTALELSIKLNDKTEQFKTQINLGQIYYENDENQNALTQYVNALKIVDSQNNEELIGKLYNSLGELHNKLKNYNKSIMYEKMALKYYENVAPNENTNILISNVLSHIGVNYYNKDSNDTALTYFFKSLQIKIKNNDLSRIPAVYINIGNIYVNKKQYQKALLYYKTALKEVEKFNQKNTETAIYNNIGEIYLILNDIKNAEYHLQKALEIGSTIKYNYSLMYIYKSLSELELKKQRNDQALMYFKKYTAIKDSLFDIEKIKDINEKIANSESELKDKKIELLNVARLKNEAENERKLAVRNLIIVIVFSLASILIFFIVMFNNKDKRARQKIFLRQLIQFQEEERKRISKELHDGIGQSLLVIKNNMTDDKSLIENTIDELRAISRNLHPIQLEKLGLKNAIESIVNEASINRNIYFSCDIENINGYLNSEKQINIYRIVQECVSNIIKHSNASSARVTFFKKKEILELSIYDNGKGFDIAEIKKKNTIGITSIEERVKLINGQLTISSKINETKIEIIIKHA